MEGVEETLTLRPVGLAEKLGHILRTNNVMENVNSQIQHNTRNVQRWTNSYQVHRYVTMPLVESEKKLKPNPNAEHLPKLRAALQKSICKTSNNTSSNHLRPRSVN